MSEGGKHERLWMTDTRDLFAEDWETVEPHGLVVDGTDDCEACQ